MFSSFIVCLVVLSNIESVNSSVTVLRSSVVKIGERVELKCSVTGNDVASWRYTSWNSSSETLIDFGGPTNIPPAFRSRYKIDKNISGQRNLIIDSVDLAHAGRYRCNGVQQSLITEVLLIVLGSHPVCVASISVAQNKVTEYPHLSIWCSISYTGNGIPVFNWTKSNADKNIAVYTTTSDTGQVPFTITSFITQQLQANDSGVTFYCRITFQTSNTFQENPVDAYEYMWHFTLPTDKKSFLDMHTIGLIITVATLFVFGVVLVIVGLKLWKLIITIDKVLDKTSAKTSSFPPHQSSKRLDSPPPTDEYAVVETADASNNYCALADQSTGALKAQLYCELRPVEQRSPKQPTK